MLQLLEDYIREAAKKGWIRKFKFLAAVNMLIARKKDKSKEKLYINYKGLNNVTI